jgi:UPF0755 protein
LVSSLGAGAAWLDSQISRPYRGHRPEKIFVDIPHRTSRWGVSGILAQNDVIRSRLAFALFSFWHFKKPLEAGEYYFDHPVTSREVFWKVARGQIYVHIVAIPEGFTMFEIGSELERQGICTKQDFLAAAHDTSLVSDFAPQAPSLEGFLFPATYEFTRHATCAQAAKRMVQNFRAVWESLVPSGAAAQANGLPSAEVVTMASLVERETPNAEERPLVAGVFYNRLRRGTPLQCDPTVQYALDLTGHHVKDVRPKDLRIDSPYNTYEHAGLPPGPIANPGEASLRAALMPTQTTYLYFVANDQGGHFFAGTLAEHNKNVLRLRRKLAAAAQASDPAAKKVTH